MNLKESVKNTTPYVLVEGPRWGDVEFYGKWLLAAAKVDALWKEAMKDPNFMKQIEALTWDAIPDFGISATVLLSKFEKDLSSIILGMYSDYIEFDAFAMMLEMGFFVLTGERYQMVIPSELSMAKVRRAALKLARTDVDENWWIHPEHLVATMPHAQAKVWQTRLRDMGEDHRCADRLLLLDDTGNGLPIGGLPNTACDRRL